MAFFHSAFGPSYITAITHATEYHELQPGTAVRPVLSVRPRAQTKPGTQAGEQTTKAESAIRSPRATATDGRPHTMPRQTWPEREYRESPRERSHVRASHGDADGLAHARGRERRAVVTSPGARRGAQSSPSITPIRFSVLSSPSLSPCCPAHRPLAHATPLARRAPLDTSAAVDTPRHCDRPRPTPPRPAAPPPHALPHWRSHFPFDHRAGCGVTLAR